MTAPKVEAYFTEDGEPWGAFVYGHDVEIASITLADINAGLDYMEIDPLDEMPEVERLWMRQEPEDNSDHPWFWCNASDEGAIAVTGVRFL